MGLAGTLLWIPQIYTNQCCPRVLKFNMVLESLSQFLEMLKTCRVDCRLQRKVRALRVFLKKAVSLGCWKRHGKCSDVSVAQN